MGKANPCRICNSLNLQWKMCWNDIWVHCDECGNISQPKETYTEAGEQWNKENPIQQNQPRKLEI